MHTPTKPIIAVRSTDELLGMMERGRRYSVKQLATLLGVPMDCTDVVFAALQAHSVRRMQTKAGAVFWIPSDRERAADARHLERCPPASGALKNYEATNGSFRDLCMLTRR